MSLIVGRMTARPIAPSTGTLGVLLPGMGAVASTFIAGVLAARKGLTPPIGSLSQMARLPLADHPAVAAWHDRLMALPAWADPFAGLDAPPLPPVA